MSDEVDRVSALIEDLKDESGYVRSHAARALRDIGPSAAAAVPALIKALMDDDHEVRRAARVALQKVKKD